MGCRNSVEGGERGVGAAMMMLAQRLPKIRRGGRAARGRGVALGPLGGLGGRYVV